MTKRKATIFDLMIITGFMLVVCAIPVGIVFAIERPPGVQPDLRWEIITGGVMSVATGITGGVFIWIGETVLRRRFKRDQKTSHDVA
jgi:hypothetical protein